MSTRLSSVQNLLERLSLRQFANFRTFQFIGDISYSLYLWHWVIKRIFDSIVVRNDIHISGTSLTIVFPVSLILAVISYYFIEKTFRTRSSLKKYYNLKAVITGGLSVIVVLAFCQAVEGNVYKNSTGKLDVIHERVDKAISANDVYTNAIENAQSSDIAIQQLESQGFAPSDLCVGGISLQYPNICGDLRGKAESDNVFQLKSAIIDANNEILWGDAYAPLHDRCFHWDTLFGTKDNPPENVCTYGDINADRTILLLGDSHAAHWASALDYVGQKLGYKIIVSVGGGDMCGPIQSGEQSEYCNKVRDNTFDNLIPNANIIILGKLYTGSHINDDFSPIINVIKRINDTGKPVYMLEDPPGFDIRNAQNCFNSQSKQCESLQNKNSTTSFLDIISKGQPDANYTLIPTWDRFCQDTTCFSAVAGVSIYSDDDHISESYSKSLGPWLTDKLISMGIVN